MTSRKPPGVSQETWVDRQVREATERGAFEGLSAAGKPLDPASLQQGAAEWAVEWARREGADMAAALPPALALRLEREQLVTGVPGRPSERAVRLAVEEFNDRLDAAYRRPQEVPPVALAFVDVDRQVTRWREAHPQPVPEPSVAAGAAAPGAGGTSPGARRWWQLGGRRARDLRGRP